MIRLKSSTIRTRLVSIARFLLGCFFVVARKPLIEKTVFAFVFHEVSNNPRKHARDTNTYSNVELFRSQVHWIKSEFEVTNLGDEQVRLAPGSAIVSFDDGYLGVLSDALPILEEFNIPAICFLNMETIRGGFNSSAMAMFTAASSGSAPDWSNSNPEYFKLSLEAFDEEEMQDLGAYQGPYLNEDEARTLASSPLITLADHLYKDWLVDEMSSEEIAEEISRNKEPLSNFPSYKDYFATPHAMANSASLQAIGEAGYQEVFSGQIHHVHGIVNVRPRIDMNADIHTKFHFYGAIATYLMRSRAWK